MDNHETAATDIAGTRIRDRERETDCDRCVNRIATAIENFNADARCMLLLGDDHTIVRMDRLRRSHCRRARRRRNLCRRGGAHDEYENESGEVRNTIHCELVMPGLVPGTHV